MKRYSLAVAAAAVAVALSGLTACTPKELPLPTESPAPTDESMEIEMPVAPVDLETYYDQEVAWEKCNGNFDCATIKVPLDYSDPAGEAIDVRILKRPAKSGQPIGTLFVNPGGPGGSGIDMAMQAGYYLSGDLLDNYDVVGFDPRGVGQSTPVECVDDATLTKLLDANYTGEDVQAQADADLALLQDACAAQSGQLLSHVGTENVARDLDILRDAVGEPTLDYLGISYGTFIGIQYAEFFPQNVGRVVLDGVMNPTLGMGGLVWSQSEGFEVAIRRYMEYCLGTSTTCPFTGSVDEALGQLSDLFWAAEDAPYPTGDPARPLTQSMLFQALILPLYGEANWPLLTNALAPLVNSGDGSQLLVLNDLGTGREADGTYPDNSSEANWAVNCADYPPEDPRVWKHMANALDRRGGTFGSYMASGSDMCEGWAYNPDKVPGPFAEASTAPIVLVGTLYDPATPYQWAVDAHEMLDNSVLLTYEGDGHSAYAQGVGCIIDPVDQYLLHGTLPQDGLTCPKR